MYILDNNYWYVPVYCTCTCSHVYWNYYLITQLGAVLKAKSFITKTKKSEIHVHVTVKILLKVKTTLDYRMIMYINIRMYMYMYSTTHRYTYNIIHAHVCTWTYMYIIYHMYMYYTLVHVYYRCWGKESCSERKRQRREDYTRIFYI